MAQTINCVHGLSLNVPCGLCVEARKLRRELAKRRKETHNPAGRAIPIDMIWLNKRLEENRAKRTLSLA